MSCTDLQIDGMEELVSQLTELEKKYPEAAEQVVKSEAKIVRGLIRAEVDKRIEGHGSKPGTLKKSFKVGKVKKENGSATCAVTSSAPHYHLVEEGHDLYTHLDKKKSGRKKIGSNVKIGQVDGRKIVAKVMSVRSEHAEELAERVLNEVLDEISRD